MGSGWNTKAGMSKCKVDPCEVCSLWVKVISVLCVHWSKWIHGRYSGLERMILRVFNKLCLVEIWKCVNFKCYSSEELITLNTLHEVVPTWYSFHSWVDWSNADKVSCSRRKHIDAEDWTINICIQGRHSNHYANCSQYEGDIGDAVDQDENLCSEVETVKALIYLGSSVITDDNMWSCCGCQNKMWVG